MPTVQTRFLLSSAVVLALLLPAGGGASAYDTLVLSDRPMLYLALSASSQSDTEADLSGHGRTGTYLPRSHSLAKTRMPNGDRATVFDGYAEYLEVPSSASLSVSPGHALTLEAWIRPDVLDFPRDESDGYVHWAGKGTVGEYEYACRMYSKQNSAGRPNRISGYSFNPQGGLGSGSYFQDAVSKGEWIHFALVIDARPQAGAPTGTIAIFKNGVLRKKTALNQFNVVPVPGDAPLRVATRDFRSFFKGAIGKFAIYARALGETQLKAHYVKMR